MTQSTDFEARAKQEPGALWRRGAQALRTGDATTALAAFRAIIQGGREDAAVWLGIAMAARSLNDDGGQNDALDHILALEPNNLRALMMKADYYANRSDAIAASSYYRAVARIGEATAALPLDLATDVRRAQVAYQSHTARFEDHLQQTLKAKGLGGPGTRRVAAALDLLLGKTEIYPQQPEQLYFPELPQIQFYDRAALPWLDRVEAATHDIRKELFAVLKDDHLFRPYIEREADRPFFDKHGMLDDPSWSALFLWKDGAPVEENARRCPKTMEALAEAPLCLIPGRTPAILFSLLRPGARIPPHNGLLNTRLICHLPLIVPEGCGFRVGNETRPWVEGQAFAFDDSIEHEAWNTSDQSRVVLIFDVWRPELSALEQEMVSAMLQAIGAFGA